MATKINKNKVIAAAQKFVQKGQYDKAIKEYIKIVEEDPRDVRIWLKIGDLYAKKNASKEAVDTYLKVAEFYSEQGFYLKAVAVYKQVLKINSSLVEINLRLAELYKQLGLLSDAMQQYEQVSNAYNQAGRTKDALAAVRQIVELDPQNVASRIKLAELYSKEGLRDEAIREFTKAADFLRAQNRIDDFVKVAERLIFHQSNNLNVSKELARVYLDREDPRRALQKLQLAFKVDPRDVGTLEMLAEAFENLDQIPKTISVLKELAHVHGENGNEAKRQEVYIRIIHLSPNDEEAQQAVVNSLASSSPMEPSEGRSHLPHQPTAPALMTSEISSSRVSNYEHFSSAHHYQEDIPTPYQKAAIAKDNFEPYLSDELIRQSERSDNLFTQDNATSEVQESEEILEFSDLVEEPEPYKAITQTGPIDSTEDIAKIFAEAEVYIKYGLQEKAVEHLRLVLHQAPENIEVHLRLKELFLQMGRFSDAAQESLILGRQFMKTDPQKAAGYLYETLDLDAGHREARALLNVLEKSIPVHDATPATIHPQRERTPEYSFDKADSVSDLDAIDLDAADIIEEIPIDIDRADQGDWTDDGDLIPDSFSSSDASSWSLDESQNLITSAPQSNIPINTHPGVIELHGTGIESRERGKVRSEVIQLGDEYSYYPSPTRSHQEEEKSGIEDDLEEAEFFIQQNLLTEARVILEELTIQYPGHPLVDAKLADLEAREEKLRFTGAIDREPFHESFSDLAAELNELEQAEASQEQDIVANYSVEDVFEEFKRGTKSQVSDEDSDTHYDLGLAYREMGLLDDAISEFKIATRSREKEVLCHMMIGLCYAEKEMLPEAISQFKTGLYVEGITERESIALYFELGQSYEQLEDLQEALYYYEKVAKKDPHFREVTARMNDIYRLIAQESETSSPNESDAQNLVEGSNDEILPKHY